MANITKLTTVTPFNILYNRMEQLAYEACKLGFTTYTEALNWVFTVDPTLKEDLDVENIFPTIFFYAYRKHTGYVERVVSLQMTMRELNNKFVYVVVNDKRVSSAHTIFAALRRAHEDNYITEKEKTSLEEMCARVYPHTE